MPDQSAQWNDWPPSGYVPTGGVNFSDAEDAIGDQEVAAATNFLFEAGMCLNRPGVGSLATTNISHAAVFARGLAAVLLNLIIDSSGLIWKTDTNAAGTQITGAGTTFGSPINHNADIINNVVLIGNNTGGIIQWDPTGNTYVVLSPGAQYRYVSGLLARAIAAYKLTGGINDPITFAYSAPGDQTVWTGSTNGSGTVVLSDAPDIITGLKVLHNVVCICRPTGVHLATNTGQFVIPFQISNFTRSGIGFPFPSTIASENNILFGVGQDDVYAFDLQEANPIGRNIRTKLFTLLDSGANLVGFTTRHMYHQSGQYLPCLRYHLLALGANTTHFCYNFEAKTWSYHSYAINAAAGFDFAGMAGVVGRDIGFTIADTSVPPGLHTWDANRPCETTSTITSKLFHIGETRELDFTLQRILLGCRDYGGGFNVGITATARLGTTAVSTTVNKPAGANNDGYMVRTWFDMLEDGQAAGVGQDFQLTLNIPTGVKFALNYLKMRLTEAGEFRG